MRFEPMYFKQTQNRLDTLLKQIDSPKNSTNTSQKQEETKRAIEHLKNLEQFNVQFVRDKPISN